MHPTQQRHDLTCRMINKRPPLFGSRRRRIPRHPRRIQILHLPTKFARVAQPQMPVVPHQFRNARHKIAAMFHPNQIRVQSKPIRRHRDLPTAATESPISVHIAIKVCAECVKVPGQAMCWSDLPTDIVGRKIAGQSAGINGRHAAISPFAIAVSTDSGKRGPCCWMAATGNTATIAPLSSRAKSRAV